MKGRWLMLGRVSRPFNQGKTLELGSTTLLG